VYVSPQYFAHPGPRAFWLGGVCKGGQLSEGIGRRVSRRWNRRGVFYTPEGALGEGARRWRSERRDEDAKPKYPHAPPAPLHIVRVVSAAS